MARVLVTDPIAEDGLDVLRRGADVDVRLGLSPAELLSAVAGYQGLVVRSETRVTAAVLDAGGHIPGAHASLREGSWDRSRFLGVELRGKTLGLLGLGRVGSEVARRARALEMNGIAHHPGGRPD